MQTPPSHPGFQPGMQQNPPPKKNNTVLIVVLCVVGVCAVCCLPIMAAILLPVFSQAKNAAGRAVALRNLKQLAIGVEMYETDFDGNFPPNMSSAHALETVLLPYVHDATLYETTNLAGGSILGNRLLGGQSAKKLVTPYATIMLYDSNPWPIDKGVVVFTDGHAKVQPFEDIQQHLLDAPFGSQSGRH